MEPGHALSFGVGCCAFYHILGHVCLLKIYELYTNRICGRIFFQRVGVMGLKIPRSITSKCGTNKKPTIGSFDLGRITFASLNV